MPKIVNYLYESGLSEQALDFLESSKMHTYDAIEYSQRLNTIMGNEYFMDQIVTHTPELGNCELVPQPAAAALPAAAAHLHQLNLARRSIRTYDPAGLTLTDLTQLLSLAYAVTDPTAPTVGRPPTRNIASGGGLYPVDLYYVSRNTQGLPAGVYHYRVADAVLERLPGLGSAEEVAEQISRAFFTEQKTDMEYRNASGFLVLGCVLNRICFKYLDRGVRFALQDVGAITHSIYLASTALGLACCGMGSYDDELANQLIGFRGTAQQVMGVVVIGRPAPPEAHGCKR